MTKGKAGELVPLAKSWLHAPEMMISSGGYEGGIYDEAERAYVLGKTVKNYAPLDFTINGSEESPLINPAIIIKNWGKDIARITLNDKAIQQEDLIRQGIRSTPYGEDLIVWFKLDCREKIKISLEKIMH